MQLENVAVLAGNVEKIADAIHFAKLNKNELQVFLSTFYKITMPKFMN